MYYTSSGQRCLLSLRPDLGGQILASVPFPSDAPQLKLFPTGNLKGEPNANKRGAFYYLSSVFHVPGTLLYVPGVKSTGSVIKTPRSKCWPRHLVAMWHWETYLTSLSFSFLPHNLELPEVLTSKSFEDEMRYTFKAIT